MASVFLSFLPPDRPGFVKLHIFEGASATATPTEIEAVTAIGAYPTYINEYTSNLANSSTDWFSIQWEDDKGALTPVSMPIQGGTSTLIGEIVERVLLRDSSQDENVVLEEAEAVVSFCFNVTDPYSIPLSTVDPLWLTSLAKLTLIAALYTKVIQQATVSSYSAGMISESTGTAQGSLDGLERAERRLLARMGIGGSRLAMIEHRGRHEVWAEGTKAIIDASRLLAVKALITEKMVVQDIPTGFIVSRD